MISGTYHKIAFYTSVTLLNAGAFMTVGLAYALPALEAPSIALAAPPAATKAQLAPKKPSVKQGIPVRVVVPSLSIDLPVQNGSYNAATNAWTLSYDSAYYATPTMPVNNDRGTTLIYGHNVWGIFRELHGLQPGNQLLVYTDTGFIFGYKFEKVQEITPENIGSLRDDGPPRVLLQTCSGVWSQYRKLFSFTLVSVEEPAKPNSSKLLR